MPRGPPCSTMSLTLQPIGVVHGGLPPPGSDQPRPTAFSELEGRVEVFPDFAPALDGIEGFSHLFILSHLDRQKEGGKGLLRVSPKRHRGGAAPGTQAHEVGVFATDSPARPNPIGLTLVRLVGRQGNMLLVRGVDVYDGTPVLDLKPYRADYKAEHHVVPRWAAESDPEREPL